LILNLKDQPEECITNLVVSPGVFLSKKTLGTQKVGFLGMFLVTENSNPPIEGVGQVVDMLGMASVV
jgi:hypothetical protein